MSKKPIIIFEGIEGTGKTTHVNTIANFFKKKKKKFIKLREPGGSKNSEKIRKILLNNKSNFNSFTDLLLILASRSENIEKIIKKNYKKKIIIIDRFTDSSLAYQHYGMKINKPLIIHLNKYLLGKIKPDFVFLNIVNKKNLFSRLKFRKDNNRYDKFNYTFYRKVQNGFLKIAKNKKNYMIINSNDDLYMNRTKILNKVKELISA